MAEGRQGRKEVDCAAGHCSDAFKPPNPAMAVA